MMPPFAPNVRIARYSPPGVLVNGGAFFITQRQGAAMQTVLRSLRDMQQEEPDAGWRLEMRGEFLDWHAVHPNDVVGLEALNAR